MRVRPTAAAIPLLVLLLIWLSFHPIDSKSERLMIS
jgi:hypothetical protein